MRRKCFRNTGGTVASILQRDKKCWLCRRGVARHEASRDHVETRSAGGYDKSKNYRLAHQACNAARGALPEAEVLTVLASLPERATTHAVRLALTEANREWLKSNRRRT